MRCETCTGQVHTDTKRRNNERTALMGWKPHGMHHKLIVVDRIACKTFRYVLTVNAVHCVDEFGL